jgi:Mg2+ and Co2+ transporter CorA
MNAKNSKDQLFYQLISDLAEDVMKDTQSATDQTINLSSQFLDANSQNLVENFQGLYESEEVGRMAENNAEDVDRILEATKTNSVYPEKASEADDQLSAVQQDVEEVIRKDTAIRAEINVILSSMQFAELLRQHLAGICNSFNILTNAKTNDVDKLIQDMQAEMHTYDERKAFYTHVLHQDMPVEDETITQSIIDQLIG